MQSTNVSSVNPASAWVTSHVHYIKRGGRVLDVAAGTGRNAIWMAQQGFMVEAVDRDAVALSAMLGVPNISIRVADLEAGLWPYSNQVFDAILVCRYLHRPLLSMLPASLAPGGVLIYETFMQGHEAYGRPQNPDFLLLPDELKDIFGGLLDIQGFEQGLLNHDPPAVMQRICAILRLRQDGAV